MMSNHFFNGLLLVRKYHVSQVPKMLMTGMKRYLWGWSVMAEYWWNLAGVWLSVCRLVILAQAGGAG